MNLISVKVDVDRLLQSAIRRYYDQRRITVPDLQHREFGYSTERGRKIQTRHVSFNSPREFRTFLRDTAPFYVSYSLAAYRFPSAQSFEEAHMLYADWVFEFDLEYVIPEDVFYCPKCDRVYFGDEVSAPKCPKCGADLLHIMVPDPHRFDQAKRHTRRLIHILKTELGVADGVTINFSGNRGFHIHVPHDSLPADTKEAREEIAHYLTATHVDPDRIVYTAADGSLYMYSHGLSGRIARVVAERLPSRASGETIIFDTDPRTLYDAIQRALPRVSMPIDVHTTTDIHRLIRVPDSVHGGTGLIAKTVNDLDEFNPYRDAVLPLNHTITARIRYLPRIEWAGEHYGPYENETVDLPVSLLLFLTGGGM